MSIRRSKHNQLSCTFSDGYQQTKLTSYFSGKKSEIKVKAETDLPKQKSSNNLNSRQVCRTLFVLSEEENKAIVSEMTYQTIIKNTSLKEIKYDFESSSHRKRKVANDVTDYSPKLLVKEISSYKDFKIKAFGENTSPQEKAAKKKNQNVSFNSSSCSKTPTSTGSPKHKKVSSNETPSKGKRSSTKSASSFEDILSLSIIKKIINGILSQPRFRCLLEGNEEKEIKEFLKMHNLSQSFCCKLLSRKPIWYNVFKLGAEIDQNATDSEIKKSYEELKSSELVDTDYSTENIFSLLKNLSKIDVVQICKTFRIKYTNINKEDLIIKLIKFSQKQPASLTPSKSIDDILYKEVKQRMGLCIKLSNNLFDLVYKYYVLYFLTDNTSKNIAEWNYYMFQINDKNVVYPKFEVDEDILIFNSRDEFLKYLESWHMFQTANEEIESKSWHLLLNTCEKAVKQLENILKQNHCDNRPSHLQKFSAGHVYTNIISRGIEYLSTKYQHESYEFLQILLGQNKYKQSRRGYWYERKSWIEWSHLKQHELAVQTLVEGIKDKHISEVAKHDLSERGRTFKNRKNVNLQNALLDAISLNVIDPSDHVPFKEEKINAISDRENQSGVKRKYFLKNEHGETEYLYVEDIAIRHYRNFFSNISKCEGQFLISLYILTFWDIIYDDSVKTVFISKLQLFPLDIYSKNFYENRKQKIDERLEDVRKNWSKSDFRDFLITVCDKDDYARKMSEFVEDPSQLCEIVECIGREQFAKICERLVKKFYLFRSGLPDLFMWSVSEKKVKFVEVKGEGDTLSTKQKLWLDFFRSINVEAEVCHVHSIGSKSGDKKKKKQKCDSPSKQTK